MAIISRVNNGLWNQLFQYALWRALSIKNNTTFKLDLSDFDSDILRKFDLDRFHVKYEKAENDEIPLLKLRQINTFKNKLLHYVFSLFLSLFIFPIAYRFKKWLIEEKDYGFKKEILELWDGVYLSWYWQTEKYFRDIRGYLLREIVPIKDIWKQNKEIIKLMENCNSVSVHFRRTDYLTQVAFFSPNLWPCSMEYYKSSVDLIEKKIDSPTYFIFSDDIEGIKNELFFTDRKVYFINHNKWDNAYLDMILMSKCKHNIIANSSFSWWGAWLNTNPHKCVVWPKKWFIKENLNKRSGDLIPDNWIRI